MSRPIDASKVYEVLLSDGRWRLVVEGTLEELKSRWKDSKDLEDVFFSVLGEAGISEEPRA